MAEAPIGLINVEDFHLGGLRNVDCFERLEQISEGRRHSPVYMAREIATGKIVALKKIRMNVDGLPMSVKREITILKKLHHKNIVQLKEIVFSPGFERGARGNTEGNKNKGVFYMVFEYMDHDLMGLLVRPWIRFTVSQIKYYMWQLLMGLHYCHINGVLHRDIKVDNLLIDNEGTLKLADFGLARIFFSSANDNLSPDVVTLWYRAPELLFGDPKYGPAIDMWSAGCVFAELHYGKPIFPGRNDKNQLEKIYELCGGADEITWPGVSRLPWYANLRPTKEWKRYIKEAFRSIDRHALSLLDRMLVLDPSQRISVKDALDSDYFRNEPFPDPKSLPKYEPSHIFQVRKRRQEQKGHREILKRQKMW